MPLFLFYRIGTDHNTTLKPSKANLGRLYWTFATSPDDLKSLPPMDKNNSFGVGDITDIYFGRRTGVLQAAAPPEDRCFSLIAGQLAFNLEADSNQTRTSWFEGLLLFFSSSRFICSLPSVSVRLFRS